MAEYEFRGDQTTHYPQFLHPEQDGILTAEPGEQIDFGEGSPPADGKWYDVSGGSPYGGPPQDVESESDPGTGDAADEED